MHTLSQHNPPPDTGRPPKGGVSHRLVSTKCGRGSTKIADPGRCRKKPRAEAAAPMNITAHRPDGFAGMIVDEIRRKGVSADYTFAAGVMMSLFPSANSASYGPLRTILARFRNGAMKPEAMIEAVLDAIRTSHSVAETLHSGLKCCSHWRKGDQRWPNAILDVSELERTHGKVDVDDVILLVLDSN